MTSVPNGNLGHRRKSPDWWFDAKYVIWISRHPIRHLLNAAVGLALVQWALSASAQAANCALPPENEISLSSAVSAENWTLQEKWVWSKVVSGEDADFNNLYCKSIEASKDDLLWVDSSHPRLLRESFLFDIFSRERFVKEVPARGLHIIGARFASGLNFDGVNIPWWISLDGSRFEGHFSAEDARFMKAFSATRSAFHGSVNMRGVEVDKDLFLSQSVFKDNVELFRAKVGGNLELIDSTFEKKLNIESAEIGGYLHMQDGRYVGAVSMLMTKIGNAVITKGAYFSSSLNATNINVNGEFFLGGTRWKDGSWLALSDAHLNAIHDDVDSWPATLKLNGLTYEWMGSLGNEDYEIPARSSDWYIGWLSRDVPYRPQPYHQLASIFRKSGYDTEANAILFEAREQERAQAWSNGALGKWLTLSLLEYIIGYGLGLGYFRVLYWVFGLTVAGAAILWWKSPEAKEKGRLWCMWASLDWMLPLVELDDEHKSLVSHDPQLVGWRNWFYVQAFAGYILAGFLGAGLTGLTQGV